MLPPEATWASMITVNRFLRRLRRFSAIAEISFSLKARSSHRDWKIAAVNCGHTAKVCDMPLLICRCKSSRIRHKKRIQPFARILINRHAGKNGRCRIQRGFELQFTRPRYTGSSLTHSCIVEIPKTSSTRWSFGP